MKNRNILLLLLGLAMIQNQTSAASKHYLVQSKGKQYLIKTEGKAKNGKGGERPLGEKLPDGIEVKDYEGDTHKLTGAIELHRLIFEDYDLEKRKDEMTSTLIDSTCTLDSDSGNFNFKEATPLFLACFVGNSKAALSLLSKGANPNKAAKNFNGWIGLPDGDVTVFTPLYFAVQRGSTEVVRRLLERGADPDKGMRALNKDGAVYVETPLYMASLHGYTEVVRSLLKRGANPNNGRRSTHKDGDVTVVTPLYVAAEFGHIEVVRRLLESKADPNKGERITHKDGSVYARKPLYIASKRQYEDSKNYEHEGEEGMMGKAKYNEIIKLLEAARSG